MAKVSDAAVDGTDRATKPTSDPLEVDEDMLSAEVLVRSFGVSTVNNSLFLLARRKDERNAGDEGEFRNL